MTFFNQDVGQEAISSSRALFIQIFEEIHRCQTSMREGSNQTLVV
jgi:hypothetical protein